MRKVTHEEILSLGAYEEIRERFRTRILAHKRTRRVFLGNEITMLFEDHDTVLAQIQEMVRAERITFPKAVREEVEAYNQLVPRDGELLATLMIETQDATRREQHRRELVGIDHSVRFEVGDEVLVGNFDAEGSYGDRVAVVRYVTFKASAHTLKFLSDAALTAQIVIEHPAYAANAVLSMETRRSLAETLDPENC
jgi:hypothetical protein